MSSGGARRCRNRSLKVLSKPRPKGQILGFQAPDFTLQNPAIGSKCHRKWKASSEVAQISAEFDSLHSSQDNRKSNG